MQVPEHCVLRPYCTVTVNDYRKSQCILITLHLQSILPSRLQLYCSTMWALQLHGVEGCFPVTIRNHATSSCILLPPTTCSHDSTVHSSSSRAERIASHGSQSVPTTWPSERQAEKTFVWESFFRVRRVQRQRLRYNIDPVIR